MRRYLRTDHAAFLISRGTDANPHSANTLFDHLIRTYALLEAWEAREAVCVAGLFHSVYSTDSHAVATIDVAQRQEVRDVIGLEAERLAYVFCATQRATLYEAVRDGSRRVDDRFAGGEIELVPREVVDLAHIGLANWFEQRQRVPQEIRDHRRADFEAMLPNLLPAAASARQEPGLATRGSRSHPGSAGTCRAQWGSQSPPVSCAQ